MTEPAEHFAGQRRMLQRDRASAALGMVVERDEPAAFGGLYRSITLRKPVQPGHPGDRRA